MDALTLKVATPESLGLDPAPIARFISEEWDRPIALSLPEFYKWQFMDGPKNSGSDRCVVVVDEERNVHGFMGLHERDFNIQGATISGAELTTWMISERARGSGRGKLMLAFVQARYDVLVGMGISEMALTVYLKQGFRWVRYIPRYVRVFNAAKVAQVAEVSRLGRDLMELFVERQPPQLIRCEARQVGAEDLVDIVEGFHQNFNCYSMHPNYVQWRYLDHPVYKYEIFLIQSNGRKAAVIVRVEEAALCRILHIIDVLCEASFLPAVVGFVEGLCRDLEVDFADFFCTSVRVAHVFWCYGWFSMLDDHFLQIPHLYFPLEVRRPPTTSFVIWSREHLCTLLDLSRLYLTKGNADLDRPTIAYLKTRGLVP